MEHPLRAWMRKHGYSQRQLAEMAAFPQPHLSEYLSGRRGLPFRAAMRIRDATGGALSLETLMLASGEQRKSAKPSRKLNARAGEGR